MLRSRKRRSRRCSCRCLRRHRPRARQRRGGTARRPPRPPLPGERRRTRPGTLPTRGEKVRRQLRPGERRRQQRGQEARATMGRSSFLSRTASRLAQCHHLHLSLALPSFDLGEQAAERDEAPPPPLSCLFDRGDRKVCGAGACEGKRFLVVSSSSFSSSSSARSFRGEKNATTRDSLSKHIPSNKKRETEVSPSSSPSFLSLPFSPSLFHRQSQKQKRVKQPRARDLHKKEREEKA